VKRAALIVVAAATLAACSGPKKFRGDDEPTLASLAGREVPVQKDAGITTSEERTIAAYRKFLEVAPGAPQRSEAMRRLGDLEMDLADNRAADSKDAAGATPDYRAAVARYQEFLTAYPRDKGNDRVLYQLARAHEQAGAMELALKTLDRLVAEHPATPYAEEAQFRRGEMLFSLKQYAAAESAFATVLKGGAGDTGGGSFRTRALYMKGWSLYKQAKLEAALEPFFGVLDLQLGTLAAEARDAVALEDIAALSRADRELVEDTFRVVSIAFSQLQGAASIAGLIDADKAVREGYEFRVYQQLGELYLKQERIKDAADTYALFVKRQPLHALSPVLLSKVIEIYAGNGFETLALESKKDFVVRYGVASEFRRANEAGWQRAQPLVKAHLTELAQHHHAGAQKSKGTPAYAANVQEAIRWYRLWLESFPTDAATPQNHFLLAELLFEDARFAEAGSEYTKVAYDYPAHPKAADAGYAALLALAETEKRATGEAAAAARRETAASALRFAEAFTTDTRRGSVLVNAADKLYATGDAAQAAAVAQRALAAVPAPSEAERRTAWTVVANTAFDAGRFAESEKAYGELLALNTPRRAEVVERLAASIYKQGEGARAAGDAKAAVGHFERVATVAGLGAASAVRATALYDTAAVQFALKDWGAAAKSLEDFRRQHPASPLQNEVAGKLAVAYLEQGRWTASALEFEKVAAASSDVAIARSAWWQAAELHDKAALGTPAVAALVPAPAPARPAAPPRRGSKPAPVAPVAAPPASPRAVAIAAWERYAARYPSPLPAAIEARSRIATLYREQGDTARANQQLALLRQAEAAGGAERTDRTRTLAGLAALTLLEPAEQSYRAIALVEPLAKNLKAKKAKLEEVLAAYAAAAQDGLAEVTTAATYRSAALYADFGSAMLKSERPKKLKKAELEQYNVMLEEQAFPFEEKAIELHETNARRTQQGVWNEWVGRSFAALAKFKPVRYGKAEADVRDSQGVFDAIR
jgi:TolA-binding protein